MTLTDEIKDLLRTNGPMTVKQMAEIIYPDKHRRITSNVYNKCRRMERWGIVEICGTDDSGYSIWRLTGPAPTAGAESTTEGWGVQ